MCADEGVSFIGGGVRNLSLSLGSALTPLLVSISCMCGIGVFCLDSAVDHPLPCDPMGGFRSCVVVPYQHLGTVVHSPALCC